MVHKITPLKVAFVNPPHADWSLPQTMTFWSMKNFYDNYGLYNTRVEWMEPPYKWDTYDTVADIYEEIKDADVFLLSSYIWNYSIIDELALHIRAIDEDKIIVLGGPHIGYHTPTFKSNRWMYNAVAQPTTPGEVFMLDLLDKIQSWSLFFPDDISFEVRSTKKGDWCFQNESMYELEIDYLSKIRRYADEHNLEKFIVLETTRGCPFKCAYCEWGGGLATKIIQKPLNIVKRDIDAIVKAGYEDVYLTDANFGVFKERDREILEYASDAGIRLTDISVVKTKDLKKRKALVDMFDGLGIDWDVHIPIQSISDQALIDADRIDLSYGDKIALGQYIRQRAQENEMISPGVEMILAMPGSTLKDFYDEYQLLYDFEALNDHRYDYMIFPDADAATPEYIAKHKMELVDVYTDNIDEDDIRSTGGLYKNRQMCFQTIASCYSYTREEMCEMFFMNYAMPKLIEDHLPPLSGGPKNWFGQFDQMDLMSIVEKLDGFDLIFDEIRDIFNPDSEPRNINTIGGQDRVQAIEGFISINKNEIYARLFVVELRQEIEDERD